MFIIISPAAADMLVGVQSFAKSTGWTDDFHEGLNGDSTNLHAPSNSFKFFREPAKNKKTTTIMAL